MVLGDSIDLAKSTAEAALADLRKLIIAGMFELSRMPLGSQQW